MNVEISDEQIRKIAHKQIGKEIHKRILKAFENFSVYHFVLDELNIQTKEMVKKVLSEKEEKIFASLDMEKIEEEVIRKVSNSLVNKMKGR